jgi:hypothetical protein
MVPDHGGRAKPQGPTTVPQTPADIDVVPSRAELRIKPAYGLQVSFAERHVTARYVLCLLVGKEDMDGTTRCIGDAISKGTIVGWCEIRASHPNMFGGQKRRSKIGQPVRVRVGIVVNIGDYLARGRC